MLDVYQSAAIVIAVVAGSVAFLGLLQRIWPADERRLHNELIGWQVTVLGTTYAVIVGFMLYAVWTGFEVAEDNEPAIALYTRRGFEQVGRRKGYYRAAPGANDRAPIDAIVMRKQLI